MVSDPHDDGSSLQRKPVPGFEDLYEITRRGDVYSKRLRRFIKQQERLDGRFYIEFQIDNKVHHLPLSETIAQAYLSPDDQQEITSSVPRLDQLSPEAITAHPSVRMLSQRYNVAPGAILSVLLRARQDANDEVDIRGSERAAG